MAENVSLSFDKLIVYLYSCTHLNCPSHAEYMNDFS